MNQSERTADFYLNLGVPLPSTPVRIRGRDSIPLPDFVAAAKATQKFGWVSISGGSGSSWECGNCKKGGTGATNLLRHVYGYVLLSCSYLQLSLFRKKELHSASCTYSTESTFCSCVQTPSSHLSAAAGILAGHLCTIRSDDPTLCRFAHSMEKSIPQKI